MGKRISCFPLTGKAGCWVRPGFRIDCIIKIQIKMSSKIILITLTGIMLPTAAVTHAGAGKDSDISHTGITHGTRNTWL